MADSSDEDVVLDKMRIAPPRTQSETAAPKAAATATTQQKQQQNGTNKAAPPAKPKAPGKEKA